MALLASSLLTTCLFSSLLLSSSPALQQELLKPWQVLFLFCYLLFIWKCLLLSVSVDWLSTAVCSSVHIYMNGWLCWYFIFRMEEGATHSQCRSTLFIFNSQVNISPHVMADFSFCSGYLVASLVCVFLMSFFYDARRGTLPILIIPTANKKTQLVKTTAEVNRNIISCRLGHKPKCRTNWCT